MNVEITQKQPTVSSDKPNVKITIDTFRYDLSSKLMNEVRYLVATVSKNINATTEKVEKECKIEGVGIDLVKARNYLLDTAYCIANEMSPERLLYKPVSQRTKLRKLVAQLGEKKVTDERLDVDIPKAARMIIRLHLLDGDRRGARITASWFSEDQAQSYKWLNEERAEAASLNRDTGRFKVADELERIIFRVGTESNETANPPSEFKGPAEHSLLRKAA